MMNFWIQKIIGMVLLSLLPPLTQASAPPLSPEVLARNTTNDVLRIVRQDREIKGGDMQKIHDLVEAKILPNFDFRKMTQLAVGPHWRRATPAQQDRLVEEFRILLVRTYAASLAGVADYKVDFKPFRMNPADTDVVVSTEVNRPGAPPIPIDYRMERQIDGWKVYDVMVDNVSMVTVYRNSFGGEVRRGGIDGLIAALARRNQTASGAPR